MQNGISHFVLSQSPEVALESLQRNYRDEKPTFLKGA